MATPIVHVELPLIMSQHEVDKATDSLYELLGHEYHVLTTTNVDNSVKIKVFHEKDFTDVKYQESKKIIEDAVKTKVND